MTPTEYEKAKALADLWEECREVVPGGRAGVWQPSPGLQDYLAAAEKRWPDMQMGTGYLNRQAVWWFRFQSHFPKDNIWGKGATPCERILDALLQAVLELLKEQADA